MLSHYFSQPHFVTTRQREHIYGTAFINLMNYLVFCTQQIVFISKILSYTVYKAALVLR